MNPYNDGLMGGDDPNVYRGYRGPMAGVRDVYATGGNEQVPDSTPFPEALLRWEHELAEPDYYGFFLDRVLR